MTNSGGTPVYRSLCFFDRDNNYLLRLGDLKKQSGKRVLEWVKREKDRRAAIGDVFSEDSYLDEYLEERKDKDEDFFFENLFIGESQRDTRIINYRTDIEGEDPEIVEVVPIVGAHNRYDFRMLLNEGIKYKGWPTRKVFLAYKVGAYWEAVLVDSDDLEWGDDSFTLGAKFSKGSQLFPYYKLADAKILPLALTVHRQKRFIYENVEIPEPVGSMPLCSNEKLATDYIEWYLQQNGNDASHDDVIHARKIVKEAFSKPRLLDEYLSSLNYNDTDHESETKQQILLRIKKVNEIVPIVTKMLLKDSDFYEECRQSAISSLHQEQSEEQQILDSTIHKREEESQLLTELENKRNELDHEVVRLQNQKEETIDKLQNDVALYLGLKTVSGVSHQGVGISAPEPILENFESRKSDSDTPIEILQRNLKRLGVDKDLSQEYLSSFSIEQFAVGLMTSLYVTRIVVIDSELANSVANALSVAISGKSACRISVPTDYSDIGSIVKACNDSQSTVFVLDNVIDTINEGLIFSLSRVSALYTFILPIGTRRNLRLMAPEIWNRVLYVPTHGIISVPQVEDKVLEQGREEEFPTYGDFELSEMHDVSDRHQGLLPSSAMVLPAGVVYSYDEYSDDWKLTEECRKTFSVQQWLESHETLLSYAYLGEEKTRQFIHELKDPRIAEEFLQRLGTVNGSAY